jgi:hypothetical protein
MMVYKTPAGVRIGIRYKRPAPTMTSDCVKVQSALLDPRTQVPRSRFLILMGRIWKWF